LVGGGAEGLDSGFVLGFLLCELAARETENHQTSVSVFPMEKLKPSVLRSKTAAASHVDDEQYPAAVALQSHFFSIDGSDHELVNGSGNLRG
jgi:hypothetical protein